MAEPVRAVVVVTYKGSPWLEECLESLKDSPYNIEVCEGGDSFDPAGFYFAEEQGIDEFVLLHDSVVVKDLALLDMLFDRPGNVALSPGFLMCMGKFERNSLPPLPEKPIGKHAAVMFEGHYCCHIPGTVLFDDFRDNNRFEYKNGRENMILENDYLIKYKGYYNMELVNRDYGRP